MTILRSKAYLLAMLYLGGFDAGLLYEMQDNEGNEESREGYHEERQAGYQRCLSCMRYQDVQDWLRARK